MSPTTIFIVNEIVKNKPNAKIKMTAYVNSYSRAKDGDIETP